MIHSRLKLSAALLALGMLPFGAQALTATAPLNVTATTVQPAVVVTVASALAFGTVQDTLTATAQSTFTVNTTTGWPYSISLDGGVNYNAGAAQSFMKDGGGLNPRQYVIYQDAARLNVWGPAGTNMTGLTGTGLAQTYTLYGSLLAAAGTTGAVSDIVTITVTY